MKKLVRYTLEQYHMLEEKSRILCGLSGGADSVSLLLCLWELGLSVCACHLNHCLRGSQADEDEAFCKALCEQYQIPFRSERCDVKAIAERNGLSIETAARDIRYDFFQRCAQEFHADRIATAHNADDNLETMLFHLLRGTGSAGLAGIPPVRGNIIRPLIAVERRQIEAYLLEKGQTWRIDASNLEDSCTRNKIRHHVMPALRAIEPAAARHALEAAQRLRQDNLCLEEMAEAEDVVLEVSSLQQLPIAVQSRKIRNWMELAELPKGEVSAKHIKAVSLLLNKSYGSVNLPGRSRGVVRNGMLFIEKLPEQLPEIVIPPETPVRFGAYTLLVTRKILDIHSSFKYYPITYDTMNLAAMTVRTWKGKDRLQLPGARGKRSLKRLYAEEGILTEEREKLPVLCCNGEIVAAAGIGTAADFCGNTGFFAVGLTGGEI